MPRNCNCANPGCSACNSSTDHRRVSTYRIPNDRHTVRETTSTCVNNDFLERGRHEATRFEAELVPIILEKLDISSSFELKRRLRTNKKTSLELNDLIKCKVIKNLVVEWCGYNCNARACWYYAVHVAPKSFPVVSRAMQIYTIGINRIAPFDSDEPRVFRH